MQTHTDTAPNVNRSDKVSADVKQLYLVAKASQQLTERCFLSNPLFFCIYIYYNLIPAKEDVFGDVNCN